MAQFINQTLSFRKSYSHELRARCANDTVFQDRHHVIKLKKVRERLPKLICQQDHSFSCLQSFKTKLHHNSSNSMLFEKARNFYLEKVLISQSKCVQYYIINLEGSWLWSAHSDLDCNKNIAMRQTQKNLATAKFDLSALLINCKNSFRLKFSFHLFVFFHD